MTPDQVAHLSDLRKLATEIGPRIEQCRREGQLSCATHLHAAREALYKAVHCYNPACDERELKLEFHLS